MMARAGAATFLYFGYGSNMWAQRILLRNPSAKRLTIGKLADHRLDFNRFAERWGGCSATAVPHPGAHIWGAVWEVSSGDMATLDEQEGVPDGIYKATWVPVETASKETLQCRIYTLINQPNFSEVLPKDRLPSRIYLEVILQGAVESELPDEYISNLKTIPHNGYSGDVAVPGLEIDLTLTRPQ